ncbi:MAG: MgtC/SapB family protein [Clostridia bacterium]|nr:MgtC/SapB family protein [Clostridia bacterium]
MKDPIVHLIGDWSAELNIWSILLRIALVLVLAAIIGCERSSKRHSAGLRTFMLVSLASTIGMLVDIYINQTYGASFYLISAAIVVGSATICVNSMLYSSKNQIKGLTTSVGLWTCAMIGLTIGAGLYTVTIISFFALLCCLSLFPTFERYLKNRSNHFEMHLELKNSNNLGDFVTTLRKLGLIIDEIEANPAYINSGMSVYSVAVTINSAQLKKYKTHREIIEALATLDYVYYIEEMK